MNDDTTVRELSLGELVDGKYQIVRLLGTGGMGRVYAARRPTLGDLVAIKCILGHRNTETNRARFLREARAAARIRHPNVVQIFDFGELDELGTPYMVMEYLEGSTLAEVLQDQGSFAVPRALAVFGRVCAAIEAGHRRGVVHRDIKPGNVMLAHSDDGRESVKVLDFGLARIVTQAASEYSSPNVLVGTVDYMSPEQVAGKPVRPASDVFSLAALLYELVTGSTPFHSKNAVTTLFRINEGDYHPPCELMPDLPPAVVDAIAAGLQSDPAKRPRSPFELAEIACAPVAGLNKSLGSFSGAHGPASEASLSPGSGSDPVGSSLSAGVGLNDPPFVGRDELLAVVREELANPSAQGRMVVLEAEAGGGKTRLLEEVIAQAQQANNFVLRGRFFAYAGDRPPPHEAFTRMLASVRDGRSRGTLIAAPTVSTERGDKWAMFRSTVASLLAEAKDAPLVVAVDDLHWAGALDLEFLGYFRHATRHRSVTFVVTLRPKPSQEVRSFLAAVAGAGGMRKLELTRLSVGCVHAFLREALGSVRVRPQDVRRIHHVSSGNPFALVELVRKLVDDGKIHRDEDGWACDDLYDVGLPDTVQTLVEARLVDIADELRRVLDIACVVGEEFRFETLQEASGVDEASLEVLLESAVAQNVLTEQDLSPGADYRFASTALRSVLYERLSPRRSRRAHKGVVAALKKVYPNEGVRLADVFAYHHHAIGDWPQTLHCSLAAARKHLCLHDPDAAEIALARARDAHDQLLPDAVISGRDLALFNYLCGAIGGRLGRVVEAVAQLQRAVGLALEAEDASLTLDALLALAECRLTQGEFAEGIRSGRRAIAMARALDDVPREHLARVRVAACAGPLGQYDEVAVVLAPVIAQPGREYALSRALAYREQAWVQTKRGLLAEAEVSARCALEEAVASGDALAQYRATSVLGMVHAERGAHHQAIRRMCEALDLVRVLSLRRREGIEHCNLGECYFAVSEPERGLELTRQGLAIFIEIGDQASEGECRVKLGHMLRSLGRCTQAIAMLGLAAQSCADSGRAQSEGTALRELADLRAEEGNSLLARALYQRAHQRYVETQAEQQWRALFGVARMDVMLGDGREGQRRAQQARTLVEERLNKLPEGASMVALSKALAEIDTFLRHDYVETLEADVAVAGSAILDQQHRRLERLAETIIGHLGRVGEDAGAADVLDQLGHFETQLREHAQLETSGLYPVLLRHIDHQVRERVTDLYSGGLGLYDDFFASRRRWPDASAVVAAPEAFAKDVLEVFARLRERMRLEEAQLHPLARS